MRRPAVVLALALTAALSGCGAAASSAGDFEGEQKAVAEAIEDIESAGQRGDSSRLCDELFTSRLRDTIRRGTSSCVAEIEQVVNDSDEFDLDVTRVDIRGSTARAVVESTNDNKTVRTTFEMVKEGGEWKAASLSSG